MQNFTRSTWPNTILGKMAVLATGMVMGCSEDVTIAGSREIEGTINDIYGEISRTTGDAESRSDAASPETSQTEINERKIEPMVCGDTIRKRIESKGAIPEKCSGKLSLEIKADPCSIEAAQLSKAAMNHAAKILEEVDCVLSKGNFFTAKALIDAGQTVYAKSKDDDDWQINFSYLLTEKGWARATLQVDNSFTKNELSVYTQFKLSFLKKHSTGEIKLVQISTQDLSGQCVLSTAHEMRIGKRIDQSTTVPQISWQSKNDGEEGKGYIEENMVSATTNEEQQQNFACLTVGANYKSCPNEDKKSATPCGGGPIPGTSKLQQNFSTEKSATLPVDEVATHMQKLFDAMEIMRKKNKVLFPSE
jgi:hypothetical protein